MFQAMPENYTLLRVSRPVANRFNVEKSLCVANQQEMADILLTEAMDARKTPKSNHNAFDLALPAKGKGKDKK